jgi:hypothetical protein
MQGLLKENDTINYKFCILINPDTGLTVKKTFLKKIPYIVITIFWAITMIMLIQKYYFPEGLQRIHIKTHLPDEFFKEQWMGAYLNGEKIGYTFRKVTESTDGYTIVYKLSVRLKMMGAEKNIETYINADTDKLFRLLSFTFRLKSDVNMVITGRVDRKILLLSINTGGLTSKKTMELKEPPYLNLSVIPNILKKDMVTGNKIYMPVIEPTDLGQGYMEVEVVKKDSIISMGRRQDVYKLRTSFRGIETFMWLTDKGEVLREESPLGFTLIRETEDDAVQPGRPSIDLIAQTAIPFNLQLPHDISYLKVRISGVDLKKLQIDGGRQTLKGDILEIRKEAIKSITPFSKGEKGVFLDEYLKDTMFIQSKDPEIVSLSKNITGNEKDSLKKTRLIYEWVYKNIKKVPKISLPMATEVLKIKQGDCNEHTTLFVALARAAGIPARIAVGITYKDGYFYYHAWPEVYMNKWIAIDPTLGQFPADASHIRLLSGDIDKQLQLLSIIGKLKLKGIDYY